MSCPLCARMRAAARLKFAPRAAVPPVGEVAPGGCLCDLPQDTLDALAPAGQVPTVDLPNVPTGSSSGFQPPLWAVGLLAATVVWGVASAASLYAEQHAPRRRAR